MPLVTHGAGGAAGAATEVPHAPSAPSVTQIRSALERIAPGLVALNSVTPGVVSGPTVTLPSAPVV